MTSAARPTHSKRAAARAGWPLERVLFALAGSMTLIGAALAVFVSPWFLLLSVLVGVNQWLFVLFGACPASIILRRLFSLPSVLYPASEDPVRPTRHGDACAVRGTGEPKAASAR